MTKLQQFQKERAWLFYRLKGCMSGDFSNLLTHNEQYQMSEIRSYIDAMLANQKDNYIELVKQKGLKYKK